MIWISYKVNYCCLYLLDWIICAILFLWGACVIAMKVSHAYETNNVIWVALVHITCILGYLVIKVVNWMDKYVNMLFYLEILYLLTFNPSLLHNFFFMYEVSRVGKMSDITFDRGNW